MERTSQRAPSQGGLSAYELARQADKLLKSAGYDIFGRDKRSESYEQGRFESGMQTGAYCSQNGRRK